jgi:hypothetical protein
MDNLHRIKTDLKLGGGELYSHGLEYVAEPGPKNFSRERREGRQGQPYTLLPARPLRESVLFVQFALPGEAFFCR